MIKAHNFSKVVQVVHKMSMGLVYKNVLNMPLTLVFHFNIVVKTSKLETIFSLIIFANHFTVPQMKTVVAIFVMLSAEFVLPIRKV